MKLLVTLALCAFCASTAQALGRQKRGWGYEPTQPPPTQGWGWPPPTQRPPPPPPPPTQGWGWKPQTTKGWGWQTERPSGWGNSYDTGYNYPRYPQPNKWGSSGRYERYVDTYPYRSRDSFSAIRSPSYRKSSSSYLVD